MQVDPEELVVIELVPGAQAERLGVAPRSRIVAVSGVATASYDEIMAQRQVQLAAGASSLVVSFVAPVSTPVAYTPPTQTVPATSATDVAAPATAAASTMQPTVAPESVPVPRSRSRRSQYRSSPWYRSPMRASATDVPFSLSEPLGMSIDPDNLDVVSVVAGAQAQRRGVTPLSRIVAVDGVAIARTMNSWRNARRGLTGTALFALRFANPAPAR